MKREDFSSIYEEYKNVVYSAVHFYARDAEVKEDLFQEIWMNVFKSLESFGSRAKLSTWIFGVSKNVISAWRRKEKPTEPAPDDLPSNAPGEEALVKKMDLERAMLELSAEDQQILFLKYTCDLDYEELVKKLGIPLSTVKSRLFEARNRLRKILERKPARPASA